MLSRTTEIAGIRLHWQELGRGQPLLLIHGLADSHRTWTQLVRAFPDRRVIVVDLPGHGLSERPDAPYTLAWYASVIGELWDQLDLEDVELVGHSFGGGIAQWLLLTHRHRVSRLALIAPGGHGREVGLAVRLLGGVHGVERLIDPFLAIGTRIAMRRALYPALSEEDIALAAWMNAAPGTARALARTARAAVDLGGQRVSVLDHAHELTDLPPTAIFWGNRDPIIPSSHADRADRVLVGASVYRYPGCGHWPHLERANDVARDLRAFFDAEPRRVRVVVPPVLPSWRMRIALALRGALKRLTGRSARLPSAST
jgi:pimeloyl-ACP methyl ester carboxylesterase